ncbi:MAG TPA: TlpA disulfide reductase family protein [Segetibacter sp.]
MKAPLVAALIILTSTCAFSQNKTSRSTEADSVLLKVHEKLKGLKNMKYESMRELNYSSENYLRTSNWSVYYDFQTTDTVTGFTFQIDDPTLMQVYNGTEKFDLNKKTKTIQVSQTPNRNSFAGLSALYNSIITLKNILPLITFDKTATKEIADTSINNQRYSLVTINIGKRRIQNLGNGFDAMTTKSNFIYRITIDKNNYLPVEVLQKNDSNNDFIKTRFNHIETNTSPLSETSWFYSTYADDYKPAADIPIPQLISNGSLSPDWRLEVYNGAKTIALSDLKGKVVLLDFWIKNCGACIQSVTHLNELNSKFKNKSFEILSINSYDSKEDISWFCNKHKTNYPILIKGKEVAEKYGVSTFPTFFIIDKTGKIIYSKPGYNSAVGAEVEQVIQKAL